MPRRKYPWVSLTDDELLEVRLKDLRVTVKGTWLEKCLRALNRELAEHDIRARPHAWISSEWFSPESTPASQFHSIWRILGSWRWKRK